MPPVHSVDRLDSLCNRLLADRVIHASERHRRYYFQESNPTTWNEADDPAARARALTTASEAGACLHLLPGRLANGVVAMLETWYAGHLRSLDNDDLSLAWPYVQASLRALLRVLADSGANELDLNGLRHAGKVSERNRVFEMAVLEVLPDLGHLTKLGLASRCAHGAAQPDYLPHCTDDLLRGIAAHCPKLTYLDVSYNAQISHGGLQQLVDGCRNLESLMVYECRQINFRELALQVPLWPKLVFLGFKEVGRLIKYLYTHADADADLPHLRLTHINNIGSKICKTNTGGLRCRQPLVVAMAAVCPGVEHLKVRVTDNDVLHLTQLENMRTVELLYNVGKLCSPGLRTYEFLSLCGARLTSVALIGNMFNMVLFRRLGEHCPNLKQLWSRCNSLVYSGNGNGEADTPDHDYFRQLDVLYFRVGENELSVTALREFVLPFILKNASGLRQLILAVRASVFTDDYVCWLVETCRLNCLQKLVVVLPGQNNFAGTIDLTMRTVDFVLAFCPDLRKLGNLLSWSVNFQEYQSLVRSCADSNYEIVVDYHVMTFH